MKATSHIRPGYGTVTPFVIVRGRGGVHRLHEAGVRRGGARPDGRGRAIGHAEVRIGDSVVMMFDSKPDWPWTPSFLRLYVPDCDATLRRALEAGATVVTPPASCRGAIAAVASATRSETCGG